MAQSDEQYRKARDEFDRLSLEDQTAFLVEAAFRTFGDAVERGGAGVADVIKDLAERAEKARKKKEGENEEGTGDDAAGSDSEEDSSE